MWACELGSTYINSTWFNAGEYKSYSPASSLVLERTFEVNSFPFCHRQPSERSYMIKWPSSITKLIFCHHSYYCNGAGRGILQQVLGNVEVFLLPALVYSYPVYSHLSFLPKLCFCLNSASPFCVLIRDVFIGSPLSAFTAWDKTSHPFFRLLSYNRLSTGWFILAAHPFTCSCLGMGSRRSKSSYIFSYQGFLQCH